MSGPASFNFEGIDDIADMGEDFPEEVKNELIRLTRIQAEFLKDKIIEEIEKRKANETVMTGHSSTQSIQPLEPETIKYESSQGSETPAKPLIFNGTLLNSVEVKRSGEDTFKIGVMSQKTSNGMAVREYAIIQEYGHGERVPPRPFLRPAFYSNLEFMRSRLEAEAGVPVRMERF